MDVLDLVTLRERVQVELIEHLLPFWMSHTVDAEWGGFVGRIDNEGLVVPGSPKSVVFNTRILWTFSAVHRVYPDPKYLRIASRAWAFLQAHFWDATHQGVFWMVDQRGAVVSTRKQVYAQAFMIYACTEYYRACGDASALALAKRLFRVLEDHAFDPEHGGYLEAFSQSWGPLEDLRLSEKDANEKKSMNTHLHVLEAYTNLYRVWPDEGLKDQLDALIRIHLDKILEAETCHLKLFFDETWDAKSDVISYGHDIEAAWLLQEAAEVLGEASLLQTVKDVAVRIAAITLREGVDQDGGVFYERHAPDHLDADKHWWPQAEAMVGFLNAYQVSGKNQFQEAALASWNYIDQYIIDHTYGEWYFRVDREGKPYREHNKVGPWKAPYHNCRACLEILARVDS